MSDKLHGGIKAGRTDISLPVELRLSATSLEATGKIHSDVTASYWRQGGIRVAIAMVTLGSVNAAHADGGFKEVDATNQPGIYRFDVPDEAFAPGADWVVISLKVAACFVQNFMFALESRGASDLDAAITGPSSVTLTFKDSLNVAVPFVDFTVLGQGVGRANGSGVAAFGLADGTYTVIARGGGMLFANTTLVVAGTTALTINGTVPIITPPAAGLCRVAGYLIKPNGAVAANVSVTFTLTQSAPAKSGSVISERSVTKKSNAAGYLEVDLVRTDAITPSGSTYAIKCEPLALDKTGIQLTAATFDLASLIP